MFKARVPSDLVVIALSCINVVADISSTTNLSNEEKRKMAERALRNNLKALGREYKDSVINLSIETAINMLKYDPELAKKTLPVTEP
jgi:hypothetical protein